MEHQSTVDEFDPERKCIPCKRCGAPTPKPELCKRPHPELCFDCWVKDDPKGYEAYWSRTLPSPLERKYARRSRKPQPRSNED
jgi:hypothetical protein